MKTVVLAPLSIAVVLFLCPTLARAQATNPAYLSEMPTVDRVKTEIKGADAMDTAARQAGAFWRMRQMIFDFAYSQRRTDRQRTPDEHRVANEYYVAHHYVYQPVLDALSAEDKVKYHNLHGTYAYGPEFLDEMFETLLSPRVRAVWEQTDTTLRERRAASQQARTQQTPARRAPASAPAAAVGAPDPSIARARAAKVDTTVFGMQLGDPYQLPRCPLLGRPINCDTGATDLAGGIAAIFGSQSNFRPDAKVIDLATDVCPSWKTQVRANCNAYVRLHDGRFVALVIYTDGRGVERTVTNELRAKYGPPTRTAIGTITPDVGNAFRIESPEWTLPGLRVQYQVVHVNNEGRIPDRREGMLRIETESAYQRRIAEEKAPAKGKL